MDRLILMPPASFIIILALCFGLSYLFSKISFNSKGKKNSQGKPYACGEDTYNHLAQPDYTNFFAFAFFFTLAHVATLVMTTVPRETIKILAMALVYIIVSALGLYILLRK
jgi:NADH:ubiquinone oxidoreductase subunit 3 (subunit A)